jgi:hypothetical protein
MDLKLEIITYEIEVKLKLSDDTIQLLDFLLSLIEDQAFNAAQSMALLAEQTDELIKKNEIYAKGIEDILKNHGMTIEDISKMTGEQLLAAGFTESEIETL